MSSTQTITSNYNSFHIQGEKNTEHLVSSLELVTWRILVNSHLNFLKKFLTSIMNFNRKNTSKYHVISLFLNNCHYHKAATKQIEFLLWNWVSAECSAEVFRRLGYLEYTAVILEHFSSMKAYTDRLIPVLHVLWREKSDFHSYSFLLSQKSPGLLPSPKSHLL